MAQQRQVIIKLWMVVVVRLAERVTDSATAELFFCFAATVCLVLTESFSIECKTLLPIQITVAVISVRAASI